MGDTKMIREYIMGTFEDIALPPEETSVFTGFERLDYHLGGIRAGELIVLASLPGMGKTTLALSSIMNMIERFKKSVLYFSLESTAKEILKKLLSIDAQVPYSKIRDNTSLTGDELARLSTSGDKLNSMPLHINERFGLSTDEIRAECIAVKSKTELDVVFIDCIQLIEGALSKEAIKMVLREIKGIAKELEIPVVALSQLSRRNKKKYAPLRIYLRDYVIEQFADTVLYLHREAYDMDEYHESFKEASKFAEIAIGKSRNSRTDCVPIFWGELICRYSDIPVEELYLDLDEIF